MCGGGGECLQMAYLFPRSAQLVCSQGMLVGVGCREGKMEEEGFCDPLGMGQR